MMVDPINDFFNEFQPFLRFNLFLGRDLEELFVYILVSTLLEIQRLMCLVVVGF